jgi:dephospho-CoA kinase
MPKKPTIGLTGGIASGKSTVSRTLARLGVGIVDADQLAREVVAKGSDGLREIVETFGPRVLAADSTLDRNELGAIVFGDPSARGKLQAITHPRIARLGVEKTAALLAGDAPYVVYDAPLLVEVGAHKSFDALIVVAASESAQLERAVARDGLDAESARKRIAAQLPLARKIEVADYVIHNDGTLAQLEQKALEVHRQILDRFGLQARSS